MIDNLLVKVGIVSKVRDSLIPERQEVKKIPESYNIKYEEISFNTKDNLNLKGWWIKGNSDITVVLSHSFGANRTGWSGYDAKKNFHKIDWLPTIKVLAEYGYNIIAFDHRACGESEGNMTYFGKKEAYDIIAAVNWVNNRDNNLNKFGIIGFSTGANGSLRAINSLEKEKQYKLAVIAINIYWYNKMIINSTKFFTNIPLFMVSAIKRATIKVVGFNPQKEIDPTISISKIKSSVMLVNSEFDEIGAVDDIKKIYEKRKKDTVLNILKGKKRFDAYHYVEKYPQEVFEFFDNYLK